MKRVRKVRGETSSSRREEERVVCRAVVLYIYI